MQIVIENAGAQKGLLIQSHASELRVEAAITAGLTISMERPAAPIEHYDDVARSVVLYVARTHEPVVIADLTQAHTFRNDPYLSTQPIQSLCCLPLIHQGHLSGVLYLENRLATHAFPADRLAMLGLLSTQAAIALENATLYDHLTQENAERRRAEAEVRSLNAELEQRVQARTADLVASEARQRLLLTQMPAVLWTTDRDMRFTSSDGAGLTGLHLRPNQGIGMSLYDYFHTTDPDHPWVAAHRRAIGGEAVSFDGELQQRTFQIHLEPFLDAQGQIVGSIGLALDISERKLAEREREHLINQLQEALAGIKTLRGLLPICASCKKIRDDQGYWNQLEVYLHAHSEVEFSHGICPDCTLRLYPGLFEEGELREQQGGAAL
jgi:PAS domain-containing protein